ncbi:MAG: asparagine synthase (glutamine-hydrolyzing) [Acidobacteria bacterium]|nr:asparagine synthase (glutamine-hydrolyzing) [Acidobacteriota bacterium]
MCGIVGIATTGHQTIEPEAAMRRMLGAIRHRGPDDRGCELVAHTAGEIWLGNTRLAIQDLSPTGHQPMRDPQTGNWIVINGEIYNHREVRRALPAPETGWRSSGDTETVLQAYAVWGRDCLQKLRGMFALVIWDEAAGELWCARDRLGIKPFYCYADDGLFVFGSELRAVLASGYVTRWQLDERGLAGFVRFGSLPEPWTLIDGVQSLPAGHWLRVRKGSVVEERRYWSPHPVTTADQSHAETVKSVRQQLERSVEEHLLSDVPVASFLSGGIDSSIVTALAAQASSSPIQTFTVGFRDAELDESEYAQAVATRYRTDHQRVLLTDDEAVEMVSDAVAAMDLPSADGVNTYVVSSAVARNGIKVVLSGLGGDELFGGYRSFKLLPQMERWASVTSLLPKRLRRMAAGGGSNGQRAAEMTRAGVSVSDRYNYMRAMWADRELQQMGIIPMGYSIPEPSPRLTGATQISLLELQGYMRSTLLRDSDAMSMAHSLELRVPLLDHKLVETCLNAQVAGSGQKTMLLEAAGDLLPDGIANRPKQGFVFPMDRWMRGPLRQFVADGISHLRQADIFPGLELDQFVERFRGGQLAWARLWAFVVLGHWVHTHVK